MKTNNWYPLENNKFTIEINADSLEQLFDKRDPNPYRRKDLDDDVVEYIVSSALEIGRKKLGKLRVVTSDNIDNDIVNTMTIAIKDFFLYRSEITIKKVSSTLSVGFKTLLIGLAFLSFSIFVSASLGSLVPDDFLGHFIEEGLLLIGWVSMWKPVNIFLYEWWPLIDTKNLFLKLTEIEIEFEQQSHDNVS